jgi:hypothetical protein
LKSQSQTYPCRSEHIQVEDLVVFGRGMMILHVELVGLVGTNVKRRSQDLKTENIGVP